MAKFSIFHKTKSKDCNKNLRDGSLHMNVICMYGKFCVWGHAGLLWGHPAKNKQKQCMLVYGWEFPPNMAVQ